MLLAVCFVLFMAAVLACLLLERSLVWAMCLGIAVFALAGLRRGIPPRELWRAVWTQGRKMGAVLAIYALIGCITGLWRSGGTIAFFIYHGVRVITPRLFILVAFLLTCLISYALGTSFGVTGTAGIILMALGRSGGVSPALTAGTILAGAYFGDRCSPASSSAVLVAASTGTRLYDNLRMMRRTGWLPLAVSTAIYAGLSVTHPLSAVDDTLLLALRQGFSLSPLTVLPAAAMILLPLCRLPIRLAMGVSASLALLSTVALQHISPWAALQAAVLGYRAAPGPLGEILSGGGMISMAGVAALALATGMYSGLLDRIGALEGIRSAAARLAGKTGLFPACTAVYLITTVIFCNQSTGAVMVPQLLLPAYRHRGADSGQLAADMENSGIVLAALVPWSIAGRIPLMMLGADASAIPYAVLLYMIPLCYGLTKKRFYPPRAGEGGAVPLRKGGKEDGR